MTPGMIAPKGSTVVPAGHPTAQTLIGYIPGILDALQAGFAINNEAGHVEVSQLITDSLRVGGTVGQEIPEAHVQLISALVAALAPRVESIIRTAKGAPLSPVPAGAQSVVAPVVEILNAGPAVEVPKPEGHPSATADGEGLISGGR